MDIWRYCVQVNGLVESLCVFVNENMVVLHVCW